MTNSLAFSGFLTASSLAAFFLGLRLVGRLSTALPVRLEQLLLWATSTPWRGLLVGTVVTAAVHSSSAVTVATVALTSAGLLPTANALGIVLGSNIGTCITIQFLAFDVAWLGLPAAFLGSILAAWSRGKRREFALAFAGIGFILSALYLLSMAVQPLQQNPALCRFITGRASTAEGALLSGAIGTAIVQSSTLFIAGLITSANQGFFSLPVGIAFVLGSNVGTCTDTLVAALWGNKAARRVAMAHLALNLLGVLVFFPMLMPFASLVSLTATSPDRQLANAHLLFNGLSSLAALPFTPVLARMLDRG